MIDVLLSSLVALMISTASPKLPQEKVQQYAELIAKESTKWEINPIIVVSIMWHESNFKNAGNNKTNDRGLMQVHWHKSSPWLRGLKPLDLMKPAVNIKAGVHELAWWKDFHYTRCAWKSNHPWWSHYKWGVKVKNKKYGNSILAKSTVLYNAFKEDERYAAWRNDSLGGLALLRGGQVQPARTSDDAPSSANVERRVLRGHDVQLLWPLLQRNRLLFQPRESRAGTEEFFSPWGPN